ncbi:MAG: metallophosphoesterase family protein, partial [Acidimicrobiales bacterium]
DHDFCFVHAADLHLDAPFKGVGQAAPRIAEALREASLHAFDSLVDLCIERRAAFLVVAGDVYDGPEHGLRAQLRFRDGLARLSAAGISSFVAHGNHDPVETGWSAVSSWPERVVIFPAGQVTTEAVERGGRQIALVHGISFGRRDERENLALGFRRRGGPGVEVGVLHCNVGGTAGYDDYAPCSLEDLCSARLDYWALGHVHQRTVLSGRAHSDEPFVVYSGNLQSRSLRQSELGPKGATVVEVRAGRVASVELVPCDKVRFEAVECDVTQLGSVSGLKECLEALGGEVGSATEGRSVVLRVHLVGRSALWSELRRPGIVGELLDLLRQGAEEADPFLWWAELRDESGPLLDLDELGAGGDFVGDLVRLGRGRTVAGETPGVEGLPVALRNRALELWADERPALLGEGLLTALEALGAGAGAGSGPDVGSGAEDRG